MDAASLLRPPADQRDDDSGAQLPRVSARCAAGAGADALDPGRRLALARLLRSAGAAGAASPSWSGITLAWCSRRWRRTGGATRIASMSRSTAQGKAELGVDARRRPTRSEEVGAPEGGSERRRLRVLWGDPATAPHLAPVRKDRNGRGRRPGSTGRDRGRRGGGRRGPVDCGIRSFQPWPATRTITIAADRDEDRPGRRPRLQGGRAGSPRLRPRAP